MKPYFICYVEGSGAEWQAHCEDFDLSVTGQSLEETKKRLEVVVRSYNADAMREHEPARTRLLNRRSPFATRPAWRLKVAASVLGASNNVEFEGRYALPCHV